MIGEVWPPKSRGTESNTDCGVSEGGPASVLWSPWILITLPWQFLSLRSFLSTTTFSVTTRSASRTVCGTDCAVMQAEGQQADGQRGKHCGTNARIIAGLHEEEC